MSRKKWTNEKIINRLINNKTDRTHWDNIRELRSRPSNELFTKCVSLVKSKNVKKRLIGIEVLSQLGVSPRPFIDETLKVFFDILRKEKINDVISTILYGIGHNNENLTNSNIKFLCSFMNNKNIDVKHGLVFALGGIENDIAIETLIVYSKDRSNVVRDWATFNLGTQIDIDTPVLRKALWNRVNDKNIIVRREAIHGLARRKDNNIKDYIIKELEPIDSNCSILLESIEELNDNEFIPILEQILKKEGIDKLVNTEWLNNTIEKLSGKD